MAQQKAQAQLTIIDTTDINKVTNYYLASASNSGITTSTSGWTTDPTASAATMTSTKIYLWNYQKVFGVGPNNTDILISQTNPVIIGHFGINGTNGTNGTNGVSISSIDDYYQASSSTTNPGSSGWTTSPTNSAAILTATKKYLWNYQVIHYSNNTTEGTYSDARIIGVYGDKGERGTSILKVTTSPTSTSGTAGGFSYSYRMSLSTVKTQSGKSEVLVGDIIEYGSNHYQVGYVNTSYVYLGPVTSIKGADGTTYYSFIKYATNSSGSGMQDSPDSTHIYIGTYAGIESNPAANLYEWSLYKGTDGVSVLGVKEVYCLMGTTNNPPSLPNNTDISQTGNVVGQWTTMVPSYVVNGIYWTSIQTHLSGGATNWVYSTAIKNNALTDENYNAYLAISQTNNSIKEIYRIWYRTNTSTLNQQYWPTNHVTNTNNNVNNTWTKTKPIANDTYQYYFYCDETITNGGDSSWTDPVLDTSNLSQYEITSLKSQLKNFFWPGDPNCPGAYAVGRNSTDSGFDSTDVSTYLHNVRITPTSVSIGYNEVPVINLKTTPTPASLDFYKPPEISESGNTVTVTQGELAASLTTNGLYLKKGGIQAGTIESEEDQFIYLSTENYSETITGHDPGQIAIDGYVKQDWRQIIGSKFAVDDEGNLYAAGGRIGSDASYISIEEGMINIVGSNLHTLIQDETQKIRHQLDITNNNVLFKSVRYALDDNYDYQLTADLAIDASKTYYTPSEGFDYVAATTFSDSAIYYENVNDTYVKVQNPSSANIASYYERVYLGHWIEVNNPVVENIGDYYERGNQLRNEDEVVSEILVGTFINVAPEGIQIDAAKISFGGKAFGSAVNEYITNVTDGIENNLNTKINRQSGNSLMTWCLGALAIESKGTVNYATVIGGEGIEFVSGYDGDLFVYNPSSGTTFDSSKTYYLKKSDDTYEIVPKPNANDISSYYEQAFSDSYKNNVVASITGDQLIIKKTVVLNEMQVGSDATQGTAAWSWVFDESDKSIVLKWIGGPVQNGN